MEEKHGRLIRVRGNDSIMVVSVRSSATADELLDAAITKHRSCNWHFPDATYKLLYPDGLPVGCLPGSQTVQFTVESYKNFIGKQYRELCVYLCSEDVYNSGEMSLLVVQL